MTYTITGERPTGERLIIGCETTEHNAKCRARYLYDCGWQRITITIA